MSRTPISRASSAGRRQRVLTLLPLALLSSAVTVHLAAPVPGPVSATSARPAPADPATPVLATPPMTPASVSTEPVVEASSTGVVAAGTTADVQGIPAPALAAYQRAETVINAADAGCNLSWQLLAAIGDVESHHGQFGVSRLAADGTATPSIIGIPLDGTNGTKLVKDTDAGLLDGDERFDRAVGPMQFIPATWAVVGVDSDNDGERNPQDIDDAALAAAVYLCSGDGDLSTPSGQAVAVHRYNHSAAYVERVLSLLQQYLAGGYGTSPVGPVPLVPVTSTVAAGRIDGLHPDPTGATAGEPLTPSRPRDLTKPPKAAPVTPPDTDEEPPPGPGPVTPSVIKLPVAPWTDHCGPADVPNVEWVQPPNGAGVTWVVNGDRLVGTAKPGWVFPDRSTSYTLTLPADSGTLCADDDPDWPNSPVSPTSDWVPAVLEGPFDEETAAAQCEAELFDPVDIDAYQFCVDHYLLLPGPEATPSPTPTPSATPTP